jgi:hypothetical protein
MAKWYPKTELQDEQDRERTKKVLLDLWDAMRLSGSGILDSRRGFYYHAYRSLGTLLLGDECPEKEQKC